MTVRHVTGGLALILAAAGLIAACTGAPAPSSSASTRVLPETLPPGSYTPIEDDPIELSGPDAVETRNALLRRADVWSEPSTPIEAVDFRTTPSTELFEEEGVCKYLFSEPGGTTPKFECVLPDGRILKVKYGPNPEIPAEVAATRLLSALGFAADRVHLLRRLRCFGCPADPFESSKVAYFTRLEDAYERLIDYRQYADFDWVAVERPLSGAAIEAGDTEGWAWYELKAIDRAADGTMRAEVDALRLMAAILSHWDNKSENQRLLCPQGHINVVSICDSPVAMINDTGATFGPRKMNFWTWSATRVWTDRATCHVSMKTLPYEGSTFPDTIISEGGRQLLGGLLSRLSDAQIRTLFASARFDARYGVFVRPASIDSWAAAFKDKVRQVVDGPPCPYSP